MSQIVVHSDPQPQADHPPFVREAYEGLTLTPEFAFQPGEDKVFPQGVHMVPLGELLRAMRSHNDRAYRYLAAQWGDTTTIVESHEGGILLPFPFECCDLRGVVQ